MKKYILLGILIAGAGLVSAQNQSALMQLQSIYTETLANTTYFDAYYENIYNRRGVSDFDNLVGEVELLRWGLGRSFDEGTVQGTYSGDLDSNPLNVAYYHINVLGEKDKRVYMENPIYQKHTAPTPKAKEEEIIVPEEVDIDDIFMDSIGGKMAVAASKASQYKPSQDVAVGTRQEENFDGSGMVAQLKQKQQSADQNYNAMNAGTIPAFQRAGGSSGPSGYAGVGHNGQSTKPCGFWCSMGKTALQGLANMAANFPAEYERYQREQAANRAARQAEIDAYNAQVDAYNRAQLESYYAERDAQNAARYNSQQTYSAPRPAPRPQLTPEQQCAKSCSGPSSSPHIHHQGYDFSGGSCVCLVCDDRIQKC